MILSYAFEMFDITIHCDLRVTLAHLHHCGLQCMASKNYNHHQALWLLAILDLRTCFPVMKLALPVPDTVNMKQEYLHFLPLDQHKPFKKKQKMWKKDKYKTICLINVRCLLQVQLQLCTDTSLEHDQYNCFCVFRDIQCSN